MQVKRSFKKWINTLCGLGLSLFATTTCAANLLDVYHDAVLNDPTFAQARSTMLADQEVLYQARSFLLPNLQLTGFVSRVRQFSNRSTTTTTGAVTGEGTTEFNVNQYSLVLTQPILNYEFWTSLGQAKYTVKQASATFLFAAQDLIIRTAQAYFAVLQAEDDLRFTEAEKRAFYRQLVQARERYRVGLDAITSVFDAKAKYDTAVADVIAAKNEIKDRMEQLSEITGRKYKHLAGLEDKLPLLTPNPDNVQSWVNMALKENFNLRATMYEAQAQREAIKVQFAGHLPTIDFQATRQRSYTGPDLRERKRAPDPVSGLPNVGTEIKLRVYSLQMALPIYEGGLVRSEVRQAQYAYQTAVGKLEQIHNEVMSDTHQQFTDIISGISKIKADRQAVISNAASVRSNEEAYKVGTRTIIDVLDSQQDLTQSQQQLAADEYTYINDILLLKQSAGTLTATDLARINNWLESY